jgi:hypothetical protein
MNINVNQSFTSQGKYNAELYQMARNIIENPNVLSRYYKLKLA